MPYFLAVLTLALTLVLAPRRAHADAQASVRSFLELGSRKHEGDGAFTIGGGLRGDVMYGPARPKAFRIGPALELRTMDLDTAEAALGAGVLIPMPGDLPIGLTGLVGPALRRGDRPDGFMGIGTVTWGFRGYNAHSWYGYGVNLFFSGRKQLGDSDLVELTGGIEIDVVFTAIIPGAALVTFLRGGDPLEK